MESNKIKLFLTNTEFVTLDSNTPNMKDMISKIVELRKNIKLDCIRVEVIDAPEFDTEGFTSMIKDIVKEYLEQIKLNDEYLKENLSQVNDKIKQLSEKQDN